MLTLTKGECRGIEDAPGSRLQASQDFAEVKLAGMRMERCFFARRVGMFSCRGRGGVLALHICTEVSAGNADRGADGAESMRYTEAKHIAGATRPLVR